jgi:PAS domain S-box-containing protein
MDSASGYKEGGSSSDRQPASPGQTEPAQEALKRAHDELEIRIRERTAELEKTVNNLAAQRQRFNDVLEMLPAYVVLLTPDHHVSFANRFFRERFGESGGRRCFEYLFGRTEPCEICESFRVLKTGSPHQWRWTGPDGRDYDISDFRFTDQDGSIVILEMGIDVTERNQAEEALRSAGAYNRSLIEASLDPLVTIGPDGRITDANAATEAVTGRSRAELIGTDFSEYFTDPEKARAGYQQVFRNGTAKDYALDLRHRNGPVTSVLYNASVYRDEKGAVAGLFAAARDITERRRAEEIIRLQADQYATLLAASSDGFWLFDMDGKLLDVNEAYCRMSGYSRAELLSLHISDLEAREKPEEVARHIRKVAETGFDRFESQHRKKDAGILDVEVSASFWRGNGHILAFVRDITQRKRGQAELQEYRSHLEELVKQRTGELEAANERLQAEIAERRRAEELAEAARVEAVNEKNRLEAVMETLPVGMVILDARGGNIRSNSAFEKIWGGPRPLPRDITDYAAYRAWWADTDRLVQPEEWASARAVQHGETIVGQLMELEAFDGARRFVLNSAAPVRDSDGNITGGVVAIQDITDIKRMERALRESEQRYHSLFNSMAEGFALHEILCDEKGEPRDSRFLDVNPAFERFTGLSREEVIGRTHSAVLPRDNPRWIKACGAVALTGQSTQFEEYSPELERHYELFAYSPAPRQVAVILKDITGRKRAEEALRQSEERFKVIASSTPDHLFVQDRELRYTFVVNPQLGLTEQEMIGKTDHDLVSKEDAERLTRIKRQVLETGETVRLEIPVMSLRGEQQVFDGFCVPRRSEEGGIEGLIGYFRNVTERKRVEEALRRMADELSRSNKDLEQFAYVISHDLKEPLRMVTGFTGLLRDRYKGRLDAKADQYIFFASDAASRMQVLIDDLLAYSRAGRGKGTGTTNVAEVLTESLKNLRVGIEESGAQITHDPLPDVDFNSMELMQVLQNLIGNAIKFRSGRKPEIHVGCRRQEDCWLLTVRDNGIGIDPRFADRIFMIFQRLHAREEYPGTGIGLAICRKIVERQGGRIWVESKPGEGSTFCFTIPDSAEEQE